VPPLATVRVRREAQQYLFRYLDIRFPTG